MSQNSSTAMQIHYRHSCRFVILLSIAALGPYVLPAMGIRMEHFVIYGSLFYVIFKMYFSKKTTMGKNTFLLMALCLAVVFWMLIGSLRNVGWATPYRICAAMENFTQPAAMIIIMYATMTQLDRATRLNLLRVAGIAMIGMLCINSLIAVLTIFYDTWPFVQYFVVAGDAGEMVTVSELAATMGRFSGVFNQPAEAGLGYSIGSIVWVYLATTSKRINSIAWISLFLLIIGGSLSVSKSFILGGLPLSMLYWFWPALSQMRIRKSTLIGGTIWGLVALAGVSALAKSWTGLDFFLRFIDLDYINYDGASYVLTGGRFGGNESGVKMFFAETWSVSPVMGFGLPLPDADRALDNAFIEYFACGGIVGLVLYIAILALILWVAFRGLRTDPVLGRFLMVLWVLIIGAGIGAPVLTMNRSSIFLWILLVITFGVLSKRRMLDMLNSNSLFKEAPNG